MTQIYTPRIYQGIGQQLIETTPGCGLFVEPGGGKTVTTFSAIANLDLMTLVVGPKLVAQEVWTREAAKWAHLAHLEIYHITAADFGYYKRVTTAAVWGDQSREIIRGLETPDDRIFLFGAEVTIDTTELRPRDIAGVKRSILDRPERIHVISRDHLVALAKVLGADWPYKMMIGDESTSYKNHDSDRSRTVYYLRREGMIERLVLLSGTPSPKGLENLWAQVRLLDGGKRLGATLGGFQKTYLTPNKKDRNSSRIFSWKPKPGAVDAVTGLISDICLSVRADIWRKNEPPRVVQRRVTLPEAAMATYRKMEQDCVIELAGSEISAQQAATLGNKLLQIGSGTVFDSDGNWHEIHDAKLDALEELIEELDGEPLLVLYWYAPNLVRLKKRFPGIGTTKTKGFLDLFAAGKMPLLALQPASAGHGLDGLQHGGHHVVQFDLNHDWELQKQAVDRIDRSGQTHQVTVHQLIAAGTLDSHVARVLADRGANQGKVMDAIRMRLQ